MKRIIFFITILAISFSLSAQTKPIGSAQDNKSTTTQSKKKTTKSTTKVSAKTTTVSTRPAKTVSTQTEKTDDNSGWHIDIGPNVAIPLKYLHMFATFGIGLDGAALYSFGNGFSAGARLNFDHFFGRKADPFFTGGGDHYKASTIFNILAEANYQFENNIFIGVDLGVGILSFRGHSDFAFGHKVRAGYEIENGDHPLLVSLFYENTITHKNIGVSVNIRVL